MTGLHYFHAGPKPDVCSLCGLARDGHGLRGAAGTDYSSRLAQSPAIVPKVDYPPHLLGGAGAAEAPGDEFTQDPATHSMTAVPYDPSEQNTLLEAFEHLLRRPTMDGALKRVAGAKPPWYEDPSHMPAIFSHLNRYMHGERRDPESGAHPLVHLAWRALAVAWQETYGEKAPTRCTGCGHIVAPGAPILFAGDPHEGPEDARRGRDRWHLGCWATR